MTLWLTFSLPLVIFGETVPIPPPKSATYYLNGFLSFQFIFVQKTDQICNLSNPFLVSGGHLADPDQVRVDADRQPLHRRQLGREVQHHL